MRLSPLPREPDRLTTSWQVIDQLLEETTQLAAAARDRGEFYAGLVHRLLSATGSPAAAVFHEDAAGTRLREGFGEWSGLDADAPAVIEHGGRLTSAFAATTEAPLELDAPFGPAAAPKAKTLAAAIRNEEGTAEYLEIQLPHDASPTERQRHAAVLAGFAEVAVEFHRRRSIQDWRGKDAHWRKLNDFVQQVYRRLDRRECGYVAADALKLAFPCDRVTILQIRRSRPRIVAISGLDTFDPRSAAVRELERIAAAVIMDEHPVWYEETFETHRQFSDGTAKREGIPRAGAFAETAASISEVDELVLRPYLDQSAVRAMGVIPLRTGPAGSSDSTTAEMASTLVGVAVFERFEHRPFSPDERNGIEQYCRHVAIALGRAAELERMPLWGLSLALSKLKAFAAPLARLHRVGIGLMAVVAVCVLGAWPVSFQVPAKGVLLPKERRAVFAPTDGVVRELAVTQGAVVETGALLLVMDNDELEAETTRLLGELQTARRQLQVVRASRFDNSKSDATNSEPRGRLAAEEERLKELVRSLETQHDFRLRQQTRLTLRSPMAGQVLTWDVEQSLRSRPVKRGQRLLTIADTGGPWILDLRVADADVGHVVEARRGRRPLAVRFVAAADPAVEHRAWLDEIADWSDPHDPDGQSVRMLAQVEDAELLQARPGATVAARITVGRRARANVWFRDLIHFVQMHTF